MINYLQLDSGTSYEKPPLLRDTVRSYPVPLQEQEQERTKERWLSPLVAMWLCALGGLAMIAAGLVLRVGV
jgi:hypothetical protein